MTEGERDETHWLRRLSPMEWVQAALAELGRAEEAFARHDGRAALAGCKRAAGMALNAALWLEPNEAWGRSYVDHVAAVAADGAVPPPVREACAALLAARAPSAGIVSLRGPRDNDRLVEATKDVIAHAYAIVRRHGPVPAP